MRSIKHSFILAFISSHCSNSKGCRNEFSNQLLEEKKEKKENVSKSNSAQGQSAVSQANWTLLPLGLTLSNASFKQSPCPAPQIEVIRLNPLC